MNYIIIKTATDNEEEAKNIANYLVDNKLVACAQISNIESFYHWAGEKCITKEYIITLKTKSSLFNEVEQAIKQIHSYEVAEIIAYPISNISKEYAKWIDETTK